MRRTLTVGLALALGLLLPSSALAVSITYAGWQTTNFYGIYGYLRQTTASPVPQGSGETQLSWINLCAMLERCPVLWLH